MVRYEFVSGFLFSLISLAQFIRAALAVPARVGTFQIPVSFSWLAFVGTAAMAVWAFRSARRLDVA